MVVVFLSKTKCSSSLNYIQFTLSKNQLQADDSEDLVPLKWKRYVSYYTGVLGTDKDIQKTGRKYQVHGTVGSRKGYSVLKVILGSFTWHNGNHNWNSFRLPGASGQKMVGEASAWYFAIEITNHLYSVGLWDETSLGLWPLWTSLTEQPLQNRISLTPVLYSSIDNGWKVALGKDPFIS